MKKRTIYLRSWALLGILTIFLFSCKSSKLVSEGIADEGMSAKAIIRNHYKGQADFRTLSGRMQIDFSDGETSQSFTVSLRMEKDKAIWISAPLGMVKAYITPTRVSFYNKLQNEYFDGDFSYLSRYLGTDLDFQKVQNLLLGQALFDLRDDTYRAEVQDGTYELKPETTQNLFKAFYRLDPGTFKVVAQQLSQPLLKRLLEIRYSGYEDKGAHVLPGDISITAIDTNERNVIELAYRNVELDKPVNLPYEIPKGYEEILLK